MEFLIKKVVLVVIIKMCIRDSSPSLSHSVDSLAYTFLFICNFVLCLSKNSPHTRYFLSFTYLFVLISMSLPFSCAFTIWAKPRTLSVIIVQTKYKKRHLKSLMHQISQFQICIIFDSHWGRPTLAARPTLVALGH